MASDTYTFEAVDAEGTAHQGSIRGVTKESATDSLNARGWVVTEISKKTSPLTVEIKFSNKVKPGDLTVATRQLATMISSGMPLLRACYVLVDQIENKKLHETISAVRDDIEAGLQFSEALARHPKVFSALYVAMVRAGEAGGVLEDSLERVADQLEKDDNLRRQVKSAMTYPSVVLAFSLMVLIALVAFIVPTFVGVFAQFDAELPLITKFTLALSKLVTQQWYLLIAAAIGAFYGIRYWKRSERGGRQWDQIRLKVPMKIGLTARKVALARWSRTFAALYGAGVPIMQAIDVTGKTAGNWLIEKAMDDVIASIRSGGTVAEPLRRAPVFPPMVCQMVAVGEESGNLDVMLSKVADFYESEVDAAIKALTSLLEPIMIVFVGGIVGFIVIAMYMPMFKVYDAIK